MIDKERKNIEKEYEEKMKKLLNHQNMINVERNKSHTQNPLSILVQELQRLQEKHSNSSHTNDHREFDALITSKVRSLVDSLSQRLYYQQIKGNDINVA